MPADALLSRRGVIRRAAGSADARAASVAFAPVGCAGCRCVRFGAAQPLPVTTELPDGTVVRVVVAARRLRREALLLFAPPIVGCLTAALWTPASGAAVVLAMLGGALAALALRRGLGRAGSREVLEVVRAVPGEAPPAPASPAA